MSEVDITMALILPPDVGLVPVDDLGPALRRQLAAQPGDYALTRRLTRHHSRLISADAAVLLRHFRHPTTIVEAVISFSEQVGVDPERTLEESFPLLITLLRSRFLVDAQSPQASPIVPTLRAGERFGELTVVESVQCLEDTEVFKVIGPDGTIFALKVLRQPHDRALIAAFEREARILKQLDKSGVRGNTANDEAVSGAGHRIAPRLAAAGVHDGSRYVQMQWIEGRRADSLGRDLRLYRNSSTLIDTCQAIIGAYARLHSRGIVHGDVHPGNIIVGKDTAITLLDFGGAAVPKCEDVLPIPTRQGVAEYFEPEYARSLLTDTTVPPASPQSDQYALAAVIYFLLTGQHYLPFAAQKTNMLRQIAYEQPVLDDELVIASGLDTVLRRALEKDGGRRYSSTAVFASAFAGAVAASRHRLRRARRRGTNESMRKFPRQMIQRLRASTLNDLAPPRCSVALGAGGAAYFLYRAALHEHDSDLLAEADIWSTAAAGAALLNDAFDSEELGIARVVVGDASVLHGAAGLSILQSLVAHAFGDDVSLQQAVNAFISRAGTTRDDLDFICGRPGVLSASSSLLAMIQPVFRESDVAPLLTFGDHTHRAIWARLDQLPPVTDCEEFPSLGISHGWAGVLYASLRWRQARSSHGYVTAFGDADGAVRTRLDELAQCALPAGDGLAWEWREPYPKAPHTDVFDAGWCNGSAGMVPLWALAHQEFGEPQYLDLMLNAAKHCASAVSMSADLCCGTIGRAYAMLRVYKHTGDQNWNQRARILGLEALARSHETRRNSLYKGDVGLGCLLMDLENPALSAMPFIDGIQVVAPTAKT